ncbi:MAG: heme-binding sensor globin domain-containing protein [Nitrospirales bacterium]|nr:heme-binding sensor globin domain-containing protein [Nitrospirales bacterium]
MRSFREVKLHYEFTPEDEKRLLSLQGIMNERVDEAMDALHAWMLNLKDSSAFFSEEGRRSHVFKSQREWFLELFSGKYDSRYYERLIRIGQTHVKTQVDAHYMNAAVTIVRKVCVSAISEEIEESGERTDALISLEKILDINLDVITSAYIEEELRAFSPAYRVRNSLITFSEWFSKTMNLILVLALIGLSLGVVGLFIYDIQSLFGGNLEQGIITALGSMLMLWVMIELMSTEISHLKGGKFHISVFVGVALVTIIRETMIATLKHERPDVIYYLIAAIFVVGLVYWLVKKTEEKGL